MSSGILAVFKESSEFKFWVRGGIIMAVSNHVKQTSVQEALATLRKGGVKARYENFIGGTWVAPLKGKYFTDYSPINGEPIVEIARSSAEDVEKALDAAHAVKDLWARTSPTDRANILLKIADKMEENLELLALAETLDNGKPIRETRAADVPLAIDHFRYFASCVRAEEGSVSEIDHDTVAYHFKEPLGVVGQIIPWNFPLLMAAWKLAPALGAGNCVILKPASNTPLSALLLMQLIADVVPAGVVNVVTGPGGEIGKALAANPRIAKIGFTGETTTGRLIMQYASEPIIPQTLELGGKSPNIFFADVMDEDDEFFDKALEGFALFAFNKGEVCTCPSRALIQESIFDQFLERAVERVAKIKVGNPLDPTTQMGAQASRDQLEKILEYIKIGKEEGAKCVTGGAQAHLGGDLENGYYVKPTVFVGNNKMRIFQEEIFGPVLSVTKFKTLDEAIAIGNDTVYGLGAGVWSRNGTNAYRVGREIKAGRVWTNCYHLYPAGAAFGGYKQSGFGRETHKLALGHYQQTKNLLVSYSSKPLGFF
jgi:aldehyde dehydrogenase